MVIKITGDSFSDERGHVFFNNDLNLTNVKRIYIIENTDQEMERGWQAHKIESRWFIAASGSFRIKLVKIDDFDAPSDALKSETFILRSGQLEALIVKPGYASSIKAVEKHSKLIVLSDYSLEEVQDNYKYDSNKWN